MKTRAKVITWIITVLYLAVLAVFAGMVLWGIGSDPNAPGFVRFLILAIVLGVQVPLMIAMVKTARGRNREIEMEDEDDLSQY